MQNLNIGAEWFYQRALIWFSQQNIAEAIIDLETVVSIDPGHASAWVVLGACYLYNEQECQCAASWCCREGLALGLDEAKYYLILAHHLSQQSLDHLVILTLEQGLERFPDDAKLRQALIDCYKEEGDWLRATHHLETLIGQFPESHIYRVNLGLALLSMDCFAEASESADWAIYLDPKDGWGYLVKGFAFITRPAGIMKAHSLFQEALSLAPDLVVAKNMLDITGRHLAKIAPLN